MVEASGHYYPGDILLEQELQPHDDTWSLFSFIMESQARAEILRVVIYRAKSLDTEDKLPLEPKEEEVSDVNDLEPDMSPTGEDNLPEISKTGTDTKIIRFRLSDEKLEKKGRKRKEKKDPNVRIICEECGKNVRCKYLKFHQRRCGKSEVDSFSCPHENCVYKCRGKSTLENHINVIHLGKESAYKCVNHICNICGKGYSRKHQLECHIRQEHLKNQDKVCPTCGKGFNTTLSLSRHMEIHSEPKYKCPACGNAFKQRATLTKHKHYCKAFKVHVPEDANHFCPNCSKGFKNEAHVRLHIELRCSRKDKK